MDIEYFTSNQEIQYTKACFAFAKKLALIDDDSFGAVKARCEAENKAREEKIKNGEIVYGVAHFSLPAYIQYELTRFKLDFVSQNEKVKEKYNYKEISYDEEKEFFESNADLFTRYNGDSFSFGEVEAVIRKRIREAEYDNEIKNILCQLADRQ